VKAKRNTSKKQTARNSPVRGIVRALRRWYDGKAPLLHFGLKFCALTALFYLILLLPLSKHMVAAVTVGEARLSGAVLNLIGQHNRVDGVTLSSGGRSAITVVSTCSGFDFLSFFSAAILVFPVPFAKKMAGLVIGIPLLLALNLVRIMSLFFVQVHYPGVFDLVHEEVWAFILIIATIALYVVWMKWAGTASFHELDLPA
jgi:exosortase/archaeosortase family protein